MNLCGNWIYYRCFDNKDWSIHKVKIDGSCDQEVYKGNINSLSYWNDYIYFTDDNGIKKINKNGTEKQGIIAGHAEEVKVIGFTISMGRIINCPKRKQMERKS